MPGSPPAGIEPRVSSTEEPDDTSAPERDIATAPASVSVHGARKRGKSPVAAAVKRMRLVSRDDDDGPTTRHVDAVDEERSEAVDQASELMDEDGSSDVDQEHYTVPEYDDEEVDEEAEEEEEEEEIEVADDGDYDEEEEEEEMEESSSPMMEADKTTILTSDDSEDRPYEEERSVDKENNAPPRPTKFTMHLPEEEDNLKRMEQFRRTGVHLDQRSEIAPYKEPPQLTDRCQGVGVPSEVWSVLVHKDELHGIAADFMASHRQITAFHRATLIDWMSEVCFSSRLHRETFHLSVDYVDRFLSRSAPLGIEIPIEQLQALGTTALFVAAKYEEIYPPKLEEMVSFTEEACRTDEVGSPRIVINASSLHKIQRFETILLRVLEWEANVTTPLYWLSLALELLAKRGSAAVIPGTRPSEGSDDSKLASADEHWTESEESTLYTNPATVPTYLRDEFMHMAYVLDVALLHTECRAFSNRVLAAAVLFASCKPVDLIERVTGLSYRTPSVSQAVEWIEPIVMMCANARKTGNPIPNFDPATHVFVPSWDAHNIQLLRPGSASLGETLEEIKSIRTRLQQNREISELWTARGNSPKSCTSSTPTGPAPRPAAIRLKQ